MGDDNRSEQPLRILQVGAGSMGQWWLRVLAESPDADLVGLVDLNVEAARRAADEAGYVDVPVAASVPELGAIGAQALLNVTIPEAHLPVSTAAMLAGIPVLCEKPLAESVAQGLSMVAASEYTGQLMMVSQSRRYFQSLDAFRRQIAQLGELSLLTCTFGKELDLGGFRAVMPHPLLIDMAIHHVDLARLLTGSEPVSVYCETSNPAWSNFAGDAVASAIIEFADGTRFAYQGSWAAPGMETSWNGEWRINAQGGTATWNGDDAPYAEDASGAQLPVVLGDQPEQIAGSLAEFVRTVRAGGTPQGEVHSNVISLATIEAAVASAETGQRVSVASVLEQAYATALRTEQHPAIREVLAGWSSVTEVLGLTEPAAETLV